MCITTTIRLWPLVTGQKPPVAFIVNRQQTTADRASHHVRSWDLMASSLSHLLPEIDRMILRFLIVSFIDWIGEPQSLVLYQNSGVEASVDRAERGRRQC